MLFGSSLPCFSSFRDHLPAESGVHCLKTIVSYTLSWFSIVYRRRVYPVTGSIMPEVKVWYFGIPFIFFSLCCLKRNKVLVTWLCLTFCDPMDYSRPGSSVHGILQARILGWVAIPFRKFSWPRDLTQVSCITGRFFTSWAARQPKNGLWYFRLCCLEELFDEFSKYPCPIDFYVLVWVDLTCSFQYVISLVKSVFSLPCRCINHWPHSPQTLRGNSDIQVPQPCKYLNTITSLVGDLWVLCYFSFLFQSHFFTFLPLFSRIVSLIEYLPNKLLVPCVPKSASG